MLTKKKESCLVDVMIRANYLPCECAYCGIKIKSVKMFTERDMRKGHDKDLVCLDCWHDYITSQQEDEG